MKAVSYFGGFSANQANAAVGVGATDNPNAATSVGGDVYYALGLSGVGNVPKRPEWPVKLHGWVNVGRVQGIDGGKF
jgi:outer membrane protein insertion porin family